MRHTNTKHLKPGMVARRAGAGIFRPFCVVKESRHMGRGHYVVEFCDGPSHQCVAGTVWEVRTK